MKENVIVHPRLKINQSESSELRVMNEVDELRLRFGIDKIMGATSMLDLIQKEIKIHPHALAS